MKQRAKPETTVSGEREAAWPERLVELAREFLRSDGIPKETVRTQLWLLLNTVLYYRAKHEAKRIGTIAREDLQDISSEKSMELMNRLEDRRWRIDDTAPGKTVSFISTVARNGIIDLQRRKRQGAPLFESEELKQPPQLHNDSRIPHDCIPERREFVHGIVDCASALKDMHRRIWLFRILLELSTGDIARHPDVCLKTGHVDVILQRSRTSVKACMSGKGFETDRLPPGVFSGLWRAFQLDTMAAQEDG